MDLSMEVLDEMDVPMSTMEGIGWVLIGAGSGILVGMGAAALIT
jgi:hypothetical protein